MSVDAITYPKLLLCVGTKSSMAPKNHCYIGLTNHIANILMPIQTKKSNGLRFHKRHPKIFVCELYGKLRTNKRYQKHPGSIYRIYRRLGYFSAAPSTKKMCKPKPYDTPSTLGVKWQLDVKYVPISCYKGSVPQKFYQYTIIDEASREQFIYPYMEQSSYSTIDFVKRTISCV